MTAAAIPATFALPASVITKVDVSRMVNELEKVDNDLTGIAVRAKTGGKQASQMVFSDQLTEFLTQNKLNLNDGNTRSDIVKRVRAMKDSVPIIHMTFAVEADPESLQYLAAWLRTYVHPQAVIDVGLQPALIAGVYLRTPNQVKDLSLRALLKNGRGFLLKDLQALRGGGQQAVAEGANGNGS